MNLAEKKALQAKYLLSGFPPSMKYSYLIRFCINEARKNLPAGSGDVMIEDKATKYVVQTLSLLSNKKLLNYLARTDSPQIYQVFHEVISIMRKMGKGFPRSFALKRIRKNTKMMMRVVIRDLI